MTFNAKPLAALVAISLLANCSGIVLGNGGNSGKMSVRTGPQSQLPFTSTSPRTAASAPVEVIIVDS